MRDLKMENRAVFSDKKAIAKLIDFLLDSDRHKAVFDELSAREPALKETGTFTQFSKEFVPAKLALGCVFWRGICASEGINDKEIENIFFKEVMNLFQSPQSLENATRFSESLYASNAEHEESPVLAIMFHLFHKIGLHATERLDADSSEKKVGEGFQFMMGVCDAMKNAFETLFAELDNSQTNF